LIVVDPFVTAAAMPIGVEPSKSCTCPFAPTDAFTDIANAMVLPLDTFVPGLAGTDIVVVVATGPVPPPPLLPQPSMKLSTQTSPRPSAPRYRFRPGRKSRNIDARPVPALSVHQLPPPPRFAGLLAAHKFCVLGAAIAVVVADGSDTFMVSVPVVLPEGIVTVGHTMPGGKLSAVGQFTVTTPTNPPLGVNVIVEVPVATVPAAAGVVAIVTLPTATVKLPVVPLPIVHVQLKFKTLLPPKATGFGSNAPNELTMMK